VSLDIKSLLIYIGIPQVFLRKIGSDSGNYF